MRPPLESKTTPFTPADVWAKSCVDTKTATAKLRNHTFLILALLKLKRFDPVGLLTMTDYIFIRRLPAKITQSPRERRRDLSVLGYPAEVIFPKARLLRSVF